MFRVLLGAALAIAGFFVVSKHPELVQRVTKAGREKLSAVASRCADLAPQQGSSTGAYQPADRSTAIDPTRVRSVMPEIEGWSSEELWRVMGGDDYDRRAAAAHVLLSRYRIAPSTAGVDAVKTRYLRSRRSEELKTGFSLLGLLALVGVAEDAVVEPIHAYVERHPQAAECDNALWALGELGSERMQAYFFQVIDERRYGPAARERAFCCLVQCGRYSPAERFEMIPRLIEICEASRDPQARLWALQGLAHCAPGAGCDSVEDWTSWWAAQR